VAKEDIPEKRTMSNRRPKRPLALAGQAVSPMRPSALESHRDLIEIPPPPDLAGLINPSNSYLRMYRLGGCTVIVSREWDRWHLSIAHPHRYPTWDEIARARYRLLPGEITAAMVLPPLEHYVNLHKNCFQILEIVDPGLKQL
jgi:hypothetical protein